MAEYIDREALAMRVLGLTIVDPMVANYADAVLLQIQQAPAADVVEVVRCRDCIFREFDNGCPFKESGYSKNGKLLPLDNDFCSYGERKETNERN